MKKDISISTAVGACILTFFLTFALIMSVVMFVQFFNDEQQAVSDLNQSSANADFETTDISTDSSDFNDNRPAYDSFDFDIQYAAFSNSGFEIIDVAFEVTDLKDYVSEYDAFNSHTYYNSLNENAKLVYHIFEYALDRSYCDVFIDISLLGVCNYSAKQILEMYSLDSPIVEQNIRFTKSQPFSQLIDVTAIDAPTKVEIKGEYYHVPCFEETKLQRKEEAIQKARDICTVISQQDSDYEKAKAIFEHLVNHVSYEELGDKEWYEADYLYDALCVGTTNCDGFANSFSLIANLCGLNNFEKIHRPSDGSAAHTWNCVYIDDIWYNIDASTAARINAGYKNEKLSELDDFLKVPYYCFGFCFSDGRKGVTVSYNELIPSCDHDMLKADIEVFCTHGNIDIIPTIASTLVETEKTYIIVITNFEIDRDDLDHLAYYRGVTVNEMYVYAIKPKN